MQASIPVIAANVELRSAAEVSARGAKHTCASCNVRYYDLGKAPVCPSCKHVNAIAKPAVKRGRRKIIESTADERAALAPAKVVVAAAKIKKGVKWR